jgi:ribosomal protein L11 methylase PrmA
MLPDMEKYLADDGKIILSGIIEPRGEEIYSALIENGYSVIDTKKENDWLAIIAEREKK